MIEEKKMIIKLLAWNNADINLNRKNLAVESSNHWFNLKQNNC